MKKKLDMRIHTNHNENGKLVYVVELYQTRFLGMFPRWVQWVVRHSEEEALKDVEHLTKPTRYYYSDGTFAKEEIGV
jgi:hypothetical protein